MNSSTSLPGTTLLSTNPLDFLAGACEGANVQLDALKKRILNETKSNCSFVVIGETLFRLYYQDKLVKNQKEFLQWTKLNLGFSKSTTYEYIISYRVYNQIKANVPSNVKPPLYQSHCQLLAKVPQQVLGIDIYLTVYSTNVARPDQRRSAGQYHNWLPRAIPSKQKSTIHYQEPES
jgi:hypothetical protein